MSYAPCKNPECKSYGKPHPNCKCYDFSATGSAESLAEGGEVGSQHYCTQRQAHKPKCKYFADGGDVELHTMQPNQAVASYLSNQGLNGLLKMGSDKFNLDTYRQALRNGGKRISHKTESLFGESKDKGAIDTEKQQGAISDWIDKGGITNDIQEQMAKENEPQMLAKGGKVDHKEPMGFSNEVASTHPDHNALLHTAKGRMSQYLLGLKPQKNAPKLAFDPEPDTREKAKSYKNAIGIAADPLHIMDKIKAGTIQPEDLRHFKNLHPELDEHLQKKITERIIEAQLKGEKPSYHIRQSLTHLMGTPLSGELTPQNIMAAQAVFQAQKQNDQGGPGASAPKSKSSAKSLTKSDQSYLTSNQSLVSRQQEQKN